MPFAQTLARTSGACVAAAIAACSFPTPIYETSRGTAASRNSDVAAARQSGAFDLGCDVAEVKAYAVGWNSYLADGCGKRATYALACGQEAPPPKGEGWLAERQTSTEKTLVCRMMLTSLLAFDGSH